MNGRCGEGEELERSLPLVYTKRLSPKRMTVGLEGGAQVVGQQQV